MTTTVSSHATGKSPTGKAISARNATTHGVFCRQTVLPHLGEDPAAYQQLLDTLINELRPRNLMERQYLELWAEASWKLRRLARWEAQLWENDALDEDTRFQKLERVSRLQNTLRRNLDRALRALNRDVQWLYERRTREDVQAKLNITTTQCRENHYRAEEVERAVHATRTWSDLPEDFDQTRLDNAPPEAPAPASAAEESENELPKNCQNELAPCEALPAPDAEAEQGQSSPPAPQNEDTGAAPSLPAPPVVEAEEASEAAGASDDEECNIPAPCERGAPRAQRRVRLQYLEYLLNSGTLTRDERLQILTSEEVNQWGMSDGGYTIKK